MPEGLATLEGEQLDIDASEAEFAAAMAAPSGDRPGLAAPAKRPPEPAPDPEAAPLGWTYQNGEWRPKQAPGRRPRSATDKPRVTEAPASVKMADKPKTAAKSSPARDHRKTLMETVEGLWFTLASVPVPDTAFGRPLTGIRTRLRVQAALIHDHAEALVGGVATVAGHNKFVARALDRLADGDAGLWVLPACMMLAPFAAATAQLWTGKLGPEEQLEKLAAQTEQDVAAYVEQLAQASLG